MSRKFLTPVNAPSLSGDPTTPTLRAGDTYANSTTKALRTYDGAAWHEHDTLDLATTLSGAKTFTGGIVANSAVTGSGTVTLTGVGASSVAGTMGATAFVPAGLTGSVAASRWVGATATGAPTTGAHNLGDWITTQDGHFFVCTVAGTPGTWVNAGTAATPASSVTSETTYGIAAAVGTSANYARQDHTHGSPATPVTSAVAGTGIGVSGATGAVTITNTGAVSVAGRTGAVTLTAADVAAGSFGAGTYTFPNTAIVSMAAAMNAGGLITANGGITLPPNVALVTGTRTVISGTRVVSTNASDTVDLGTFASTGGAVELRIHVHLAAPAAGTTASVTKVYEIAAGALMGTVNTWYLCLPADASANAAATNDFALEANRTAANTFAFRFRQKSIGAAGIITFTAETLGDALVTFTPSTTVTAAPTAVATPHPSNVFVAAAGNVGIGTEAPSSLLHVNTLAQVSGTNPAWMVSDGASNHGRIALATGAGAYHPSVLQYDVVVVGDTVANTQGVLLAAGPTSTGYLRVGSAGTTVGGTLSLSSTISMASRGAGYFGATDWINQSNLVGGIPNDGGGTASLKTAQNRVSGFYNASVVNDAPGTPGLTQPDWWTLMQVRHQNAGNNYGWQLAEHMTGNDTGALYYRAFAGGDGTDANAPGGTWYRVYHSGGFYGLPFRSAELGVPTGLGTTIGGTTRYYKVTALNLEGVESAASAEVSGGAAATISWTGPPGAVKYRLYRGTATGAEAGYFETASLSVANADTVTLTGSSAPPTTTVGATSTFKAWQGQTSDIVQCQSSAGANLATVNSDGRINAYKGVAALGIDPGTGVGLYVAPGVTGSVASLFQAASGQIADITQWKDGSGNLGMSIKSNGTPWITLPTNPSVVVGNATGLTNGFVFIGHVTTPGTWFTDSIANEGVVAASMINGGGRRLRIGKASGTAGVTPLSLSDEAGQPVAIIKGQTGQTGGLTEWHNVGGTPLTKVAADGGFQAPFIGTMSGNHAFYSDGVSSPSAMIRPAGATLIGLGVKGQASQSGDLQQWLNNGGTPLSVVTASGLLVIGGTAPAGGAAQITLTPPNTSTPGLAVQTVTSQASYPFAATAPGTTSVIAGVTAGGNVQGTGAYTNLSDARSKTSVVDLPTKDALSVILGLRPRHFSYTTAPDETHVGFVAQELIDVIPEAVVPFDDDRLGTRDAAIIAYLVAAVQQLVAERDGNRDPRNQ